MVKGMIYVIAMTLGPGCLLSHEEGLMSIGIGISNLRAKTSSVLVLQCNHTELLAVWVGTHRLL
jgi:hypothetical protein